ncbi:hypothetical protein [Sediminibacillus halophilus]|uniref:Uncharacterized protein n=1 Tax=Sediminibacillus halophilus TaxID=482461 RepID=A0A1G9W331_9BACI|nr:hypothetical protein [Sediminibacillus halophilus]SDM78900.1 hypothetical protein SAMN05216244_3409 [Sediminibacillus halophilus]
MKKSTMGMIAGSTALVSAGTVMAVKKYQEKSGNGSVNSNDMMEKVKTGASKTMQKAKTVIDKQMEMMNKEKQMIDQADTKMQEGKGSSNLDPTIQKKDKIASPDAPEDEAEKGLTGLDHEYRSEWVANGFPQTHREMERLEEEDDRK